MMGPTLAEPAAEFDEAGADIGYEPNRPDARHRHKLRPLRKTGIHPGKKCRATSGHHRGEIGVQVTRPRRQTMEAVEVAARRHAPGG